MSVGAKIIYSKLMRAVQVIFYGILILVVACSSPDLVQISGQSYFPLRVGNYWIYQVKEIDISHISCSDTTTIRKNYQVKMLVYDSVQNTDGSYTYHIHRYTKSDTSQTWTDLDTWSARIDNNQVIVNEENVPYVKFIFPFSNNLTWDGNVYNNLGEDDYVLKNYNTSYVINRVADKLNYPFTLTVVQSDNQDYFVHLDERSEVYTAYTGLLYKSTTQLTYFQDPCYGEQKVQTGLIYTQTLIGGGYEHK